MNTKKYIALHIDKEKVMCSENIELFKEKSNQVMSRHFFPHHLHRNKSTLGK